MRRVAFIAHHSSQILLLTDFIAAAATFGKTADTGDMSIAAGLFALQTRAADGSVILAFMFPNNIRMDCLACVH